MNDLLIAANDIELRTESFGGRNGEPLLLIMGATGPGIYWRESFIQRFVEAGCFVIRYDHRDTGRSSCRDFSQHPYTLDDLVDDALAVLDGYGLASAHVAGVSMGGMITQLLAARHSDRLRSATIVSSSPISGVEGDILLEAGLPGPSREWVASMMALLETECSDGREAIIDRKVDIYSKLIGSAEPFDEAWLRQVAAIEVEEANNLDTAMNHSLAVGSSQPADRRALLVEIETATLVVHGTEDPVFPLPHGLALAELIPNAKFLPLERGGHDMSACFVQTITDEMLALQSRVAG